MRLTQERRLFALYRAHPDGLSDRQVSDYLGLTCALASARRNGLAEKLQGTGWRLWKVGTAKDERTRKTVQIWTVRRCEKGEQAELF
jgi:hypothetical protein